MHYQLRITSRHIRVAAGLLALILVFRWLRSPSTPSTTDSLPFDHHHGHAVNDTWPARADRVRQAFLSAYHAYEEHAFGYDELMPVSNKGSNNFNGWGVTIIDSLDTMLLMELKPEYTRALEHVKNLRFTQPPESTEPIPFFETTIRYLGGLLSAYTLTSDKLFLTRADELGRILLPAFQTRSGLPSFSIDPTKKKPYSGPKSHRNAFSETTSFGVEFLTLWKFTGNRVYKNHVDRLADILEASKFENDLWPTFWDGDSLKPLSNGVAIGGNADSGYEYLLKTYLADPQSTSFRTQYISSSTSLLNTLLYLSPSRHLLYATDIPNILTGGVPSNKFEHLSCFFPGLLALGVHTLHEHLSLRQRRIQMWAAEGLGETCWALGVGDSVTGLGAEEVVFKRWARPVGKDGKPIPLSPADQATEDRLAGRWVDAVVEWERGGSSRWRKGGIWGSHEQSDLVPPGVRSVVPVVLGQGGDAAGEEERKERGVGRRDYWLRRPEGALRPEVVESMFILWKTTGDRKWREKGWQVCEGMIDEEGHARTPNGAYSTVRNVDSVPVRWTDSMPSWFLAETLKYCFLLASERDLVPLDRYVFNTQGHPVPRWGWEGWKRKKEWNLAGV